MRDSGDIEQNIPTTRLFIEGLVQGVGFRPFVFRLADSLNLKGFVYNQNNGVVINIQGTIDQKNIFIKSLKGQQPPAASITKIHAKTITDREYLDFHITNSKKTDNSVTGISPDIAVCDQCLLDMKTQKTRLQYPFTNCTNCGPRFSIIKELPYDRPNTSMQSFTMCNTCKDEYSDVRNRRFHAQPIGCNQCGPSYQLVYLGQKNSFFPEIIERLAGFINQGGVIAIKGLGGYNICCNAFNPEAVKQVRKIKNRDKKPFAIMFRSPETAQCYLQLSPIELEAITSWQRPIVITKPKSTFPQEISGALNSVGAFLPYLPIHYQLFNKIKTDAIVLTSGNIGDCPIIIDNKEALQIFSPLNIPILTNNRDIVNRVDDSVVIQIANKIRLIRRSRGYVPSPMPFSYNTEGILATGAELSNTFAIGKGKDILTSQHIGDLKNYETQNFYEKAIDNFKKLFAFTPTHVVCDMHPDYLSTHFADKANLPVTYVQHHHAHIATTMAEYGVDEQVIGVVFDGAGYGTDGNIWGSEFFIADLESFKRLYHFEYIDFSGGDNISKKPWLSATGYLFKAFKGQIPNNLRFFNALHKENISLSITALRNNINTYKSCSVGRLFDAVAALTGICTHAGYHAEAPVLLEQIADPDVRESYPIRLQEPISWNSVIRDILKDINNNISTGTISSKFHNTLIKITFETIQKMQQKTGINKVILSGGCFQNRILSENLLDLLNKSGIKAFISARIPCNDGGIAPGQIAIAAKSRALCV